MDQKEDCCYPDLDDGFGERKNRKPSEKHITYHEAGHVVAYFLLVGTVEATIIPEYDQEGNCIILGLTTVSSSVQPTAYF
jgi:hypothetical protein